MTKKEKPLILVLDDNPENLKVIGNILEENNFEPAVFLNSQRAMASLLEEKPELILLDIMMPDIDGYQFCRKIKNDPSLSHIPVIFLTAKTEPLDIVKGFEAGGVDYVTKPFNSAELLARVRTHLELKFTREGLQALNHTKDKFFSIIAHDLRNPLQCLLLAADLLQNDYERFDDSKRKEFIRTFYDNSLLLSTLLENLLNWAQSQTGSIAIKPGKIDVQTLIDESIALLSESAHKKNITLSSCATPGTTIYADPNMLRSVLRNLVSNAIKFTHPSGSVTITTQSLPDSHQIKITVTDTGIGINPQALTDLFRLDLRKNTPGTANEKGTGLGLLLCQEFVKKNNGTIHVTSQPGQGTSFTITLPTYNPV